MLQWSRPKTRRRWRVSAVSRGTLNATASAAEAAVKVVLMAAHVEGVGVGGAREWEVLVAAVGMVEGLWKMM